MDHMLTQQNMRPYLEAKLFPDLRQGIQELLKTVMDNKELDRHWHTMEREN